MKYLKLELSLVGLFLVVAMVNLVRPSASSTEPRGYEVLGADLEPFRSEFNAKTDHLRAVLLVGPT